MKARHGWRWLQRVRGAAEWSAAGTQMKMIVIFDGGGGLVGGSQDLWAAAFLHHGGGWDLRCPATATRGSGASFVEPTPNLADVGRGGEVESVDAHRRRHA